MGILLTFISAVFAASKDLVSKKIAFSVGGTVSAFASFAFAIPFYLLLLLVLGALGLETFELSRAFLILVLLRALCDSGAEWLKMHAFTHGDISFLACFISLNTLFTLLLSPFITGDPLSLKGAIGVLLTVIGALALLYDPKKLTTKLELKGVAFATSAAFLFGLQSCFDRLAVLQAGPAWTGFTMTAVSALIIAPAALRTSDKRNQLKEFKKPFLIRGIFEVTFMVIKLTALQFLQAPYVSGIMKVSLLLSIIGGRVFFKERDFTKRALSGVLIITGIIFIIFAES